MSTSSPVSSSRGSLPEVPLLTTPIPAVKDILLDTQAAGHYLGVSTATINNMLKDGRLRGEVTGKGEVHHYRRVKLSEVERFRQDWARVQMTRPTPTVARAGGLSSAQLAQRRLAIQRATEVKQQRRAKVERVLESMLDRLVELERRLPTMENRE